MILNCYHIIVSVLHAVYSTSTTILKVLLILTTHSYIQYWEKVTLEGNITTTPINGAMHLCVQSSTSSTVLGRSFTHQCDMVGQKRLGQVSAYVLCHVIMLTSLLSW